MFFQFTIRWKCKFQTLEKNHSTKYEIKYRDSKTTPEGNL